MNTYIYKNCPNDFYVYAKPTVKTNGTVINYIRRYLGHPVITVSRIDSYDGGFVTYHYNRHEDEKLITEKRPSFIGNFDFHVLPFLPLTMSMRTINAGMDLIFTR